MEYDEAYRTLAIWPQQFAAVAKMREILELAAKANSTEQEIRHRQDVLRRELEADEKRTAATKAERQTEIMRLDQEIETRRIAWAAERKKRDAEINAGEDEARRRLADVRATIASEEQRGLATKTRLTGEIREMETEHAEKKAALDDLKSKLGAFLKV